MPTPRAFRFLLRLTPIFLAIGCSSNYVLPDHPMLTPEVSGKTFGLGGEVESFKASKAAIDVSNGHADNPLSYQQVSNLTYLPSVGLFSPIDVFASFEQDSIPLFGLKIQLFGSNASHPHAGHRLAISAAYGVSANEMDGNVKLDSHSNAKDFSLIHGYRFSPGFLLYDYVSYTQYHFDATVESSNTTIDGMALKYDSNQIGAGVGLELSLAFLFVKGDFSYRRLTSSHTPMQTDFVPRLAAGLRF